MGGAPQGAGEQGLGARWGRRWGPQGPGAAFPVPQAGRGGAPEERVNPQGISNASPMGSESAPNSQRPSPGGSLLSPATPHPWPLGGPSLPLCSGTR